MELKSRKKITNDWNKQLLDTYVHHFPSVRKVLAKHLDECPYALGAFRNKTYHEMWDMFHRYKNDKVQELDRNLCHRAYNSVNTWLSQNPTAIKSMSMREFRKYVERKEKEVGTLYKVKPFPSMCIIVNTFN